MMSLVDVDYSMSCEFYSFKKSNTLRTKLVLSNLHVMCQLVVSNRIQKAVLQLNKKRIGSLVFSQYFEYKKLEISALHCHAISHLASLQQPIVQCTQSVLWDGMPKLTRQIIQSTRILHRDPCLSWFMFLVFIIILNNALCRQIST